MPARDYYALLTLFPPPLSDSGPGSDFFLLMESRRPGRRCALQRRNGLDGGVYGLCFACEDENGWVGGYGM